MLVESPFCKRGRCGRGCEIWQATGLLTSVVQTGERVSGGVETGERVSGGVETDVWRVSGGVKRGVAGESGGFAASGACHTHLRRAPPSKQWTESSQANAAQSVPLSSRRVSLGRPTAGQAVATPAAGEGTAAA
eukprot:252388-Chlamydomonas_euryale.AAC.1